MVKNFLLSVAATAVLFSSAQAQQSHRNCGTMDVLKEQLKADPSMQQRIDAINAQTETFVNNGQNKVSAITTIPVVFHILYNTTAQNISDARIMAQLDVLNKDYARQNADAANTPAAFQGIASATTVQFCLAQRDPSGNSSTGIIRKSTTKTSFSSTGDPAKFNSQGGSDAWPTNQYLNIWVCNLGGGLLGYAQFPGGAANTDGVVVLTGSVGGPSAPGTSTPYHLGRTLTHEVGHWLNLYHIWGDDGTSCTGSDLVSDTPNQADENYGCPVFPTVSCTNGPNGDMFMNYMDYTDDGCMNAFTAGQSARIGACVAGPRASLSTSLGCVPVTPGGCNTPASLSASSITQTSVVLSWGAVSGAVSYNVQYRAVGASAWNSTSTTATTVSLSGLVAATNYEFQVQAVCSNGSSAFSASSTFTTLSNNTCSDNYEANNTSGTAKTIAVSTDIFAFIGTSTDVDWFRFTTVAPNTRLKATLSQLPFDYDLQLYNSSNTSLAISQNGSTLNEVIIRNATTAATYKLRVYGYNGAFSATSCYKLRVDVSSSNFVKSMPLNDETLKYVAENNVSAYPNPTSNDVTFMFNADIETQGEIKVYDMVGKQMMSSNIMVTEGTNIPSINIANLNTGIYIVEIFTGSETLKVKVIKE